jgi:Family of unknown function (DUF6361)
LKSIELVKWLTGSGIEQGVIGVKRDRSKIAWVSFDEREISEVLAKLKDLEQEATVDVLGLGQVADRLSDIFFPGTSTLHTRLRYVIFVPAIVFSMLENRKVTNSADHLKKLQRDLMNSLLRGKEKEGVIGRKTKDGPVYWPAGTYWTFVRRLRVLNFQDGESIDRARLLSYIDSEAEAGNEINESEGDEFEAVKRIDQEFASIAKELFENFKKMQLKSELGFKLTTDERKFLRKRIKDLYPRSLSAELLDHSRTRIDTLKSPFDIVPSEDAIRDVLSEAEKFSRFGMGATYAYRWALCTHLYDLTKKGSPQEELWRQGQINNLKHFETWLNKAGDLKKWSLESLETALSKLAVFDEFKPGRHDDWLKIENFGSLSEFMASVSKVMFGTSSAESKLKKMKPIMIARESVTKPGRSHFTNPEISIPDVTTSKSGTDAYLYDYRFGQGKENAKDLAEFEVVT